MPHKTKKTRVIKKQHATKKREINIQSVNCNKNLPGFVAFEHRIETTKNTNVVEDSKLIQFINFRNTPNQQKFLVNDYYSYMCDPAIKDLNLKEIPKYIFRINKTTLLQDKIYRECIDLIESNKHVHKNLYKYYQSAKEYISIDVAIKYANEETSYIDKLRLDTINNNLWKLLAHFNSNVMFAAMTPLQLLTMPNEKDITKFALYIKNQCMYDYKSFKLDNVDNKAAYFKYVNSMFVELFGANHGIDIYDIIQVNNDICACANPNNTNYEYHVLIRNNENKYNFNYEEFFKELGYTSDNVPSKIIVKDIMYFEKVCKLLLDNWNTVKWRGFWIMIYTSQLARFSNKLHAFSFDYYLKYNQGWIENYPSEIRALKLSIVPFFNILSDLYLNKYTDSNGINYLTTLVNELKIEFYNTLQNNTWLSPVAKKEALLNIENLKIIIGKTFNPINDSELSYGNNVWENILSFSLQRTNNIYLLNDTNVIVYPQFLWNKFPFEIEGNNIFEAKIKYNVETNLIHVPSGYIREPTMDLRSKGIIYNLANIGFDIISELNNVINDIGSRYNSNGTLLDTCWWTASDTAKYTSLTKNIINEYISLANKDKKKYNITGLEPNIITFVNGLHICHSFLQKYYYSINMSYAMTDSRIATFFSYFAVCHRELLLSSPIIELNPCLSYKYLVNLALSKNEIFNAKFHIKKGENMYIENKEILW